MTTNEIWAAAQEDGRQIAFSTHTNQISNRLRASPLFSQHGTVRQRSARGAIGDNVGSGSLTRAGSKFYQDGMYHDDASKNMTSVKKDADFHDSPLWDIVDLQSVANEYARKTHKLNTRRRPAILRIKLLEMGVIE